MKSSLLKSAIVLIVWTFSFFVLWAQNPGKMSYQAVIRNNTDRLVINQEVGMRLSIIQDDPFGASVYVETHTTTTNANGLISIEIGDGTVEKGDFSLIDWTNGPYFLKSETDPTGGTNYTLTGTSQLLSVPYAFHSKTAEEITGTYPETDPVYKNSQAAKIKAADITNLGNLSGTNTGDQNLSGIAANKRAIQDTALQIRAGMPDIKGIDVNMQAIKDTAIKIRTDFPVIKTYSVGDFAQGGIVFWVDETGKHGLVCAKEDQDNGSGIKWYNDSFTNTEAKGDGFYAGEMNSLLIIANQGSDSDTYAAGKCANYTVTQNGVTYGDWYLPSKAELELIMKNRTTINATASANSGKAISGSYWSSTENLRCCAWSSGGVSDIKNVSNKVRAVRAF